MQKPSVFLPNILTSFLKWTAHGQELPVVAAKFALHVREDKWGMFSSNCVFIRRMLLTTLLLLPLLSQAETQYNSVPSMKETLKNITAAAGVHVNLNECTSINKVGLRPTRMITSYTCPVPESTRPQLRSEFLAHGWESEKILDGAMSNFRKLDQTATLYCEFKTASCKLRLQYAPKND